MGSATSHRKLDAQRRTKGQCGEIDFALLLALQKGKCRA